MDMLKYAAQITAHLLILRPFLKLFCGMNIVGMENARDLNQRIIIANHNSHLDACLLFAILPLGRIGHTHAVADKEYFTSSPIVECMVRLFFNPIFISRGQKRGDNPLASISDALAGGDSIVIFPEGTRGAPGEMAHFKTGIGRIVERFPHIPILPVFLAGTERSLPKKAIFPLPVYNRVVIGPPRFCSGKPRNITAELEAVIKELAESELASRHRRPESRRYAPVISLLGIDGSGKSTVSRLSACALAGKVCRISDGMEFFENGKELHIQPLITERLRERIGSYAKGARSLKSYKIPKLAELLLRNHLIREAGRWYNPDYVITDGSPLLNILSWAVLYKDELLDAAKCEQALRVLSGNDRGCCATAVQREFPELSTLKRLGLNRLIVPDMIIFLDVPADEACRRIASRAQRRQVHETEDKLDLLRKAYQRVCRVVQETCGVPLLITDGTQPREVVTSAVSQFIAEQQQRIGGRPCP